MMNKISAGMRFKNSGMDLTVLDYCVINNKNLALLIRSCDGLFITVRNLNHERNDYYSWAWGHYYPLLIDAINDYDKRKNDL